MFEFVLLDAPGPLSGDVARRDVAIASKVWNSAAEIVDVSRALEVNERRGLFVDCEIVCRREVENIGRLGADRFKIRFRDTQVRPGDVAFDKRKILERRRSSLSDLLDGSGRL